MIVAGIILAALVGVGLILWIHDRLTHDKSSTEAVTQEQEAPAATEEGCCGMHITCEKDSLLAMVSEKIEYYDDEELDIHAGRAADSYSEEETEQFRDVLLTLLPNDIAGWARSLELRGIAMPTQVREELLMIVAETRQARLVDA